MTTATEQTTWGHLRSALAFDQRIKQQDVADKLGLTPQKFSWLLREDRYSVPTPEFVAEVIQAIDEVKADLDAGRAA